MFCSYFWWVIIQCSTTSKIFEEFSCQFWVYLSNTHWPKCTASSFSRCMSSPFPCHSWYPINPCLREFVQFLQTICWLNLLKKEMLNLQLTVISPLKLSFTRETSPFEDETLSLLHLPFRFPHSLCPQGLPAVHITHQPVLEILDPHSSAIQKQVSHLCCPTLCTSVAKDHNIWVLILPLIKHHVATVWLTVQFKTWVCITLSLNIMF